MVEDQAVSMRSAKSSGKFYVAVYFTNISSGTAESELGFRLIRFWETISTAKGGLLIGLELLLTGKQKWLRTTRNLPHQYFSPVLSVCVLESLWQLKLGSIFMCGLFQQTIIKTLSWLPANRLRIHLQTQRNSNALYSEIMLRDPRAFYTDFYHARWNWKHCSFHCDFFASRRVPFCANKFFKTVLGFSLVILLWAVDRLGRLWLLSWQQEQE
ncbi:LOW QUALITY PROTEIN: hypothetical protein HID58_043122 [Brassica napus]|uniref:Uncharacterized protein n=1 Tax=Brassica napus TaxID=3708 RepID=A0ABQ8BFK6_BRANA|nr:LOW QUALITY PROTEIN: hypothetical protein HID58_043122 [Brassica napus]